MRRNFEAETSHVNIDTQMNLLNTWLRYKVPDYYQNIFLAYLDQQTPSIQEQQIRRQIKQTLDKSSFFYRIEKAQQDRKIQLTRIQQILYKKESGTENQLQTLSKEANILRNRNLQVAENVLKMYDRYKCNKSEAIQRQSPYYHSLFDSLDKDNSLIKGSELSKYIDFGEAYDPFLMNSYEQFHRIPSNQVKQRIKELYNMNISQVYRFMKAKNSILDIKSQLKQVQSIQQYSHAQKNRAYLDSYLKKGHHRSPKEQDEQSYMESDNQPNEIYPKYQMKDKKSSNKSMPIKISPIKVLPSRQKSRTTIYPNQRERIHSPIPTQNNYDLKFTKMSGFDVFQQPQKNPYKRKTNRIYMETQPSQVNHDSGRYHYNSKGRDKVEKGKSEKFKIERLPPIKYSKQQDNTQTFLRQEFQGDKYQRNPKINKSHRISQQQSLQKSVYRPKLQRPRLSLPQRDMINSEDDTYKIINYNPIKRQQFNRVKFELRSSKYSYNPQKQGSNRQQMIEQQDQEEGGLIKQTPISKFNLKRNNPAKKQSFTIVSQSIKAREKISQEVQTEIRQPPASRKQSQAKDSQIAPKNQNSKPIENQNKKNLQQRNKSLSTNPNDHCLPKADPNSASKYVPQRKNSKTIEKSKDLKNNTNLNDSNRTLEQEDFIDERPSLNQKSQPLIAKQPVIREANPPNGSISQRKNDSTISNIKNSQKKQIKMKIGKQSLSQILNLLSQANISPQYKKIFNVQKLADWIKANQTYLTQFHIDNSLGIIALCSPIPTIGIALKLWAPVNLAIDPATSSNLFLKYVQFIEKSTTIPKILFSGNGQDLRQLQAGDFTKKKENLYQRIRKLPPKNIQSQFKPFLYIQCSNVVFTQNSPDTLLFSEEIQQFIPSNHYVAPYIEQIDINAIPKAIVPLLKINQSLQNFKQVNKILQEEEFDCYEAGDLKVSSISLLRLILNTPLKTNFIAGDGCIHLMASILYEQKDGLLASVGTAKQNGTLYLAKGMNFKSVMEKQGSPPISKGKIGVRMFSKTFYGRFPARPKGCYGNWQFSLTWQDEMPGRIRHPIPNQRSFGPSPFIFCIQLCGEMIYGGSISSEDLIV